MTLLIYLFGDLYAHAHLEMSISMFLSPQVVAIEVVVAVVLAIVNLVVTVALTVVGMYCLLARWSSPLSILWKFQINAQINSWVLQFNTKSILDHSITFLNGGRLLPPPPGNYPSPLRRTPSWKKPPFREIVPPMRKIPLRRKYPWKIPLWKVPVPSRKILP